jgi:acetylornithine deacetylase/succinyl-diaminopimelate desuccinylase-like protein
VQATTDDSGRWREAIYELAAFDRPSASDGERRAAELIAARLRELGCEARVEEERAHGGYWWPIALANSIAAVGGLLALRGKGRLARAAGALAAGTSAAALWDDLGHGSRWFRRRTLPHRPTWNVVAEAGDRRAERTLVLVAHHDAAHSGLVFHPALGRIGPRCSRRCTSARATRSRSCTAPGSGRLRPRSERPSAYAGSRGPESPSPPVRPR